MSTLSLSLLGPLQATLDDKPLEKLRTIKAQALLYYLAVTRRSHFRPTLAGLLWGDVPEVNARNNLRRELSGLRRAIPEITAKDGAETVPLLLADRQTVQLNPDGAIQLDVARFVELLSGDPTPVHLTEAVALFRDDFLCDFFVPDSVEFEDWATNKRSELRRQALDALEALTDHHIEHGTYDQAQTYAWRALEIDDLRESAHRALMTALAAAGQRTAALAQYQICQKRLREELGVEPTVETTALFEQIQSDALRDTRTRRPQPVAPHGGMPIFLFTDIEGSTPLWENHREAMLPALLKHNSILEEQIDLHGGRILELRGDGVKAVFEGVDPLPCVLAIQMAFGTHDWGPVGEIRIRIGLHGVSLDTEGHEYFLKGDHYYGPALHHAARIMDAGHGGQILVSESVRNTFPLPPGSSWQDFGEQALKGVEEPQPIFGLLHPDLPLKTFPSLRTVSTKLDPVTLPRNHPFAEPPQVTDDLPRGSMPFIGREAELTRLDGFLNSALAGRGQVALITGEAGQGKTSLLDEFTRRALDAHADLIVASGICDVYTGVGDPYLPFRDVMSMLTADVVSQWAAGTISRDHALRLWHLLPQAITTLVTCGPDLIDTFIAGEPLLERGRAYAGGVVEWLGRLEALAVNQSASGADQGPDRNRLFEEFSDVLAALAQQQPIMLIIDDLHWADVSSISLLGHLGRRMTEHPILILGAYRPEDVAQGRDDEPHPLEGILSEFKRQFGDVWISLGGEEPAEGRTFVDALLDSEPNRLGETFRQKLVLRTEGHPLFTVELLRDMQDRGDLVRDEDRRWGAAPDLNWDALPARIEGVIEKRIGRLDSDLREALTVASVEGETFTAEVIARVRGGDARALVRHLSGELDRQHRLVREHGIQRVDSGRLSQYRFRHNLFQTYLYKSLGELERTYLHEDVGHALEALYGDQKGEIAAQLARHFLAAGLRSKALDYLAQAGDAAARLHANDEAIAHYRQALELARQNETTGEQWLHLYTRLGRALELNSEFDQALVTYQEMEELAQQEDDPTLELAALMAQIPLLVVPTPLFDPQQGLKSGKHALILARELDDQVVEAKLLWNLSIACAQTDLPSDAIDYGERSLALARQLNLREQIALTLTDLGVFCYAFGGRLDQAKEALREASAIWRELDNLPMLANNQASLGWICAFTGEYVQAETYSQEALQLSEISNNVWGQSYSRYQLGDVYWDRGEPDKAIETFEACIRYSELAGIHVTDIVRANLAVAYGGLGVIERGLNAVRLALAKADPRVLWVRPYVLGRWAQLCLEQDNLTEATVAIDEGLKSPGKKAWAIFHVPVRIAQCELFLRQADYGGALTVIEDLLTDLHEFGMRSRIPSVLYLEGQALMGVGQRSTACDRFWEARAEAEAIGSRRMLWRILAALASIEDDPAEAEHLRREAQGILEYTADHIGDPELRDSFLSQCQVQAVFQPVSNE